MQNRAPETMLENTHEQRHHSRVRLPNVNIILQHEAAPLPYKNGKQNGRGKKMFTLEKAKSFDCLALKKG